MESVNQLLLYIRAQNPKSSEPILDDLTRKMTAAFTNHKIGAYSDKFYEGGTFHGLYTCICGAHSTAVDYLLASGYVTNSLCVHYLAWHRDEIHQIELDRVAALPDAFIDPSPEMLQ